MSLAINAAKVTAVLLAGRWYAVKPGSFDLDSYEFLDGPTSGHHMVLHGGGRSGVCATGFCFVQIREDPVTGETAAVDGTVAGPLTAVQAVRYDTE
jgi:hypothetical protein